MYSQPFRLCALLGCRGNHFHCRIGPNSLQCVRVAHPGAGPGDPASVTSSGGVGLETEARGRCGPCPRSPGLLQQRQHSESLDTWGSRSRETVQTKAKREVQGPSKVRRQARDKGPVAPQKKVLTTPSASSPAISPASWGSLQTKHLTVLKSGRERRGRIKPKEPGFLLDWGPHCRELGGPNSLRLHPRRVEKWGEVRQVQAFLGEFIQGLPWY